LAEASHAVFLSYASEDAEAARKICEALRAGGIEVFLDQSALRGGDAWDQKIRRQIKSCGLFIPLISRHTHERAEGYFRLEWKLAIDRSHLIVANRAFLMPVVIDDTRDDDENVPDRFHEVQWTRLAGGETPSAFVERIRRLLSPSEPDAPVQDRAPLAVAASPAAGKGAAAWRWKVALLAVAAAVVVAIGYIALKRSKPEAQLAESNSIAVLPLANESGDASQQYFSDGISEDLITALSQFPGLNVIGRSSSFQFRDSKEDSRSIGAKLGVTHLLEGSVRRSGDMVRVNAELINAANGITQWSERYDRPYKDLFELQDEITREVAGALRTKLLPGGHAAAQSERPPSGSLDAYNAVLQGQFYNSRGTEADSRKAIESFSQATELDPRYALAWSLLSRTWTSHSSKYLEGAAAQDAYVKARAAAEQALTLAPDLAAAHVARGYVLQNADFDWRGAEAEYRRALELAPNDGFAKFSLGNLLASFGQLEQAIELTREALATEPLRATWYNWLAVYLSGLNRLDEAERAIRRALELQPGAVSCYETLTVIAIQRGNAEAALAAAQHEVPGTWRDVALTLARQIGSDRSAADAALKALIDRDAGGAAYQIAEVYALRNDSNETFAWLDRAWSSRDPGIGNLLYDPFILRYKDDPRLAAFCKKVGLPTPAEMAKQT
jgi:TolB-like protein/Flp pilus assembly protein TadD